MFQDSWGLYEARHPKKWIFHPRKRSVVMPMLPVMAALVLVYETVSRF